MPVMERVRDFVVAKWPDPVCDDCIADALELAANHVEHRTGELAELPRFFRERRGCSICSQIKEVIRYA